MHDLDLAIDFLGVDTCDRLLTFNDWHIALYRLARSMRDTPGAIAHIENLQSAGRPAVAREVWRRKKWANTAAQVAKALIDNAPQIVRNVYKDKGESDS